MVQSLSTERFDSELMSSSDSEWHGTCDLILVNRSFPDELEHSFTSHQASCSAPLKLMRGSIDADGRFEVPLLHTAGGLVGGDQLSVKVKADSGTRGLLTTASAQKVYGSIGISTIHPQGKWAKQACNFEINNKADFEWWPQEVVLFGDGLFQQNMSVGMHENSSFLSVEIVRLGRTASGENLGSGCWRSQLEICRCFADRKQWEFVDQLELGGKALSSDHGMANQPVFGSMVWVAPSWVSKDSLKKLVQYSLAERNQLEGTMACSTIEHGLSARYRGLSSQAARFWFFRIWTHTRKLRKLSVPKPLRVWPMQENPITETMCNMN